LSKKLSIKVIDLFAGPGGLGEGFFSYKDKNTASIFKGICSIEMDEYAHKTLTLRSFYRKTRDKGLLNYQEILNYVDGKSKKPSNIQNEHLWEESLQEAIKLELGKDITSDEVFFSEIAKKTNTSKDEHLVVIGGPPCQAYSLVGRARNKGTQGYVAENDHRHYLYKEYLKIVELFKPSIFVMENVKGLLSAKVDGGQVFQHILNDLQNCGDGYDLYSLTTGNKFIKESFDVRDFLIKCEDYGIPQNRHRVIILGIRKDISKDYESIPTLQKTAVTTVRDAITDLPPIRSKLSKGDNYKLWKNEVIKGVKALICSNQISQKDKQFNLFLNEKLEQFIKHYKPNEESDIKWIKNKAIESDYKNYINELVAQPITTSHETKKHMASDLIRYFYCSSFTEYYGNTPKSPDFPELLTPNHKNWKTGKFCDRFKTQKYDSPSSTVTSHIAKDGHYFIHPDPLQCRALTVREAARLQTFPDSYQFMGGKSQQYKQVGNAVPPLLASKIANLVNGILK